MDKELCEVCHKEIDNWNSNPSKWGVLLPYKNGNGERKYYHQGCLVTLVDSTYNYNSDKRDAERYRYIKRHMEWRRINEDLPVSDEDSYSFVGCRFPYSAVFDCEPMLDFNIDKMIERE